MKALLIRITAGIIALGALLYFLACTPPATNQNQNLAARENQGNANDSPRDERPCNDYGSDPGTHAKHIRDKIKEEMSPSLRKLLKDDDNPRGTFSLTIVRPEGKRYFVALIKGRVSGDDNLKDLGNILNNFQTKEECLRLVYLIPGAPSLPAALSEPGFEWSTCEWPKVVCPNGECCTTVESNSNANTGNTNTNGNSNANANGNSNAP